MKARNFVPDIRMWTRTCRLLRGVRRAGSPSRARPSPAGRSRAACSTSTPPLRWWWTWSKWWPQSARKRKEATMHDRIDRLLFSKGKKANGLSWCTLIPLQHARFEMTILLRLESIALLHYVWVTKGNKTSSWRFPNPRCLERKLANQAGSR